MARETYAEAHGVLGLSRFQDEVRRGVRVPVALEFPNVLGDIVKAIELNPAFPQSRLLTRLLSALLTQCGEFRRADVYAFDTKTRRMVVALLDAFAAGVPGRDEWQSALKSALVAQGAYTLNVP